MIKINNRVRTILVWVVGILLFACLIYWYLAPRFVGDIAVDPIAFGIGKYGIRWYGPIIALAILISYELVVKPELKRKMISEDRFMTFLLFLVIFSLIGARLGFVIQHLDYYKDNLTEIIATWQGGLAIHGAILFGIIWVFLSGRRLKLKPMQILDLLAPALLLAMAIGRFGNFFNQELFGKPTDVAWKMYLPPDLRPEEYSQYSYFHPVFLYESMINLAIFGLLMWIQKRQYKTGTLVLVGLMLYSLGRFVVEFWRYNEAANIAGLSLAQWVSLGIIIVTLVGLIVLYDWHKKTKIRLKRK